jgi:hypothetical protein
MSAQNGSTATKPATKPAGTPASKGPTVSLVPLKPDAWTLDHARHLLWRAGFGGTPAQLKTIHAWGLTKSLDQLFTFVKEGEDTHPQPALFENDIIRPFSDEERAMQRRAARDRDEDTLAEIRVRRQQAERLDREQMQKVQQWWLTELIQTNRPLREKLVLFWHGHFATNYRTIEDSYHMYQQNRLFRRMAAGNFGDLLRAIIRDPAMLAYLDNNDSRKGKPNENLARELMELFSLGVGAYTEQDIKEGARALTGYTFRDDEFTLDKRNHDEGIKRILGASGDLDGDDFVNAILRSTACATYMATKFYRFFAHDYPTGDAPFDAAAKRVIDELASGFRKDYSVERMLRRLLASEHFFDARIRAEQIKSPVQLVVGAVRSLHVPARDISVLTDASDRMGQSIFFPPSVKGWDGGRSWINTSTMFARQNLMVFLLTGRRAQGRDGLADQEKFQAETFLSQALDLLPADARSKPAAQLDALCAFTLGTPAPRARNVLESYVADNGASITPKNLPGLMLLITALPEYQLC